MYSVMAENSFHLAREYKNIIPKNIFAKEKKAFKLQLV